MGCNSTLCLLRGSKLSSFAGILYTCAGCSLTSSRKLLCIDLNTIKACSFDLPDHVLEEDDKIKDDDTTLMGCLGISSGLMQK